MSTTTTATPLHGDLLPLPGFPPDSVPFAVRTTLSLLLAYGVAFSLQLDSASSAGLCVAIVAQPAPGMALSKAAYRAAGTVLGGAAALGLAAAFPQDRTMLLLCFTLWLGVCTFVAALLRDFRSYGAVLCGYTVGIIAVGGIDSPDGVLLATLNRVAAILIGVLSVAVVNTLLARPVAFDTLTRDLEADLAVVTALALDVLRGRATMSTADSIATGSQILQLRTQAVFASAETAGGAARRQGAVAAIAGLLGMLSACRALAAEPADPAAADSLARAAAALAAGAPMPAEPAPATPSGTFFRERAGELLDHHGMAVDGLRVLEQGGRVREAVRLRVHYDSVGAALSAVRTVAAVASGSVFCIVAGWPGAPGLLVQQAAFTALLGMSPNPSAAGEAMGWALLPAAFAAWLVGYIWLPSSSGFVPFSLAVGLFAFVFALAGRHPRLQRFGSGFLLYFTLLLAPSDVQSFDLGAFSDDVLVQIMAVVFMVLAFRLILPVSPKRRLLRIADAVATDLERTMTRGRTLNEATTHLLEYDRLTQALVWAGRRTPARVAVLDRLCAMIDIDLELRRAWSGLLQPGLSGPAVAAARAALLSPDPDRLDQAAAHLLDGPGAPAPAVSGLHAAARLLRRQRRALRHYGLAA